VTWPCHQIAGDKKRTRESEHMHAGGRSDLRVGGLQSPNSRVMRWPPHNSRKRAKKNQIAGDFRGESRRCNLMTCHQITGNFRGKNRRFNLVSPPTHEIARDFRGKRRRFNLVGPPHHEIDRDFRGKSRRFNLVSLLSHEIARDFACMFRLRA
jgi:hypothetical protein